MVTSGNPDVLVIGAGVSGLTTAICLAEAGRSVTVAAAEPPQRTTSVAAGAVWGPHLVGMDERVARWGSVTLRTLAELAADPAATGVRLASGLAASGPPLAEPFDWVSQVDGVRRCETAELPAGYAAGWRLTAPIVSMPVYLGYLLARLERAGGSVREARFGSLPEAADVTGATVIVNCSGAGARRLVPDSDVSPVRGQVVVIANPGIEEFHIDHSTPPPDVIYLFPHRDTVVLGGTMVHDDWDTEPRPAVAERILADCAVVEPRVLDAPVVAHRVGLRPARPEVRLEAEPLDDGRVLWHNYGHGGAGVSISWGCAREIAEGLAGRE